jgi:Tfp pilus assembly protein PilP
MRNFVAILLTILFFTCLLSQERREEDSIIKSYQLQKEKKITPSKRNPFLKKEEIVIPEVKKEGKEQEDKNQINIPVLEFKGFIISKGKKLALISINGVEGIVGEGEEITNFKILKIKEDEIEVIYLLTNENLRIPFKGGEQ